MGEKLTTFELQSLWNPFRDWNPDWPPKYGDSAKLQSLWNPFRDWNGAIPFEVWVNIGFKASETLLGIETTNRSSLNINRLGFKASETLLGIETYI